MSKLESRPYEYNGKDKIVAVEIQNNLGLTTLFRDGYTFLDVLSDVGGISLAVTSAFATIVGFLNYNHLESYMASLLFKLD